jgi:RNA recognition motif-containing protein
MDPMDDYYHAAPESDQPPNDNGDSNVHNDNNNIDLDNNVNNTIITTEQQQQQLVVDGNNIPDDQCKLFVGALSWQTTEESLRLHFEKYGPVYSVEVVRDRHTGGTLKRLVCFSLIY